MNISKAIIARYAIHAASIEPDGLRLSEEPRAVTDCASEALRLAGDPANHGPEGAAIVCRDGRVIYTADEYDRFRAREPARGLWEFRARHWAESQFGSEEEALADLEAAGCGDAFECGGPGHVTLRCADCERAERERAR